MKITEEIVIKINRLLDHGLVCGLGHPEPGKMCVEAAVNFALGNEHGDEPDCVGTAVRSFKIALNDASWSTEKARAEGMRKLAIAQLGSDGIDQAEFSRLLALRTMQKMLPKCFRKLGELAEKPEEKKVMEEAAVMCEEAKDFLETHKKLKNAIAIAIANAYAYAYAYAIANANANANAYAYANANAYAYAYAIAIANAYANAYAKDEALNEIAEIGLGVLIEMKSPGCQWLHLCEMKEVA